MLAIKYEFNFCLQLSFETSLARMGTYIAINFRYTCKVSVMLLLLLLLLLLLYALYEN
jgi:hypothetical protein